MNTAPLDTPRSKRRPDLPIVFPLDSYVYFPDTYDGYCVEREQLREEFDFWLSHLGEKIWWTPQHETALRRILNITGSNED